MCKKAGLLIGWHPTEKRAFVARANCDSWKCEECALRMGDNWGLRAEMGTRALFNQGDHVDFITITSHEKLPDFEATETVWRSAWGALYNALKRKNNALAYLMIPERHKSGRMHVHGIWNAGVTKRWLKDNARKRGLGYQCEIVHISTERYASKYIAKYLGKNLCADYPARFRRVRCSNNWVHLREPNTPDNELQWEYVGTNGALAIVYEQCQVRGVTLIDKETGEYFDDVDLGTIVSYA